MIEAINNISTLSINVSESISVETISNDQISFGNLVFDGIQSTSEALNKSDVMLQKLAVGDEVSTHELMMSLENAKLQLQLVVEVRNKLLEGYQEIMRMQL